MKLEGNFRTIKKERPLRPLNSSEDLVSFFIHYVLYLSHGHVELFGKRLKADAIQETPLQDFPVFLVETVFIYQMLHFRA